MIRLRKGEFSFQFLARHSRLLSVAKIAHAGTHHPYLTNNALRLLTRRSILDAERAKKRTG